jgi:hypothetical protein
MPKKTKKSKKTSSLQVALTKAIEKWAKSQGTLFHCAFRDALTDMMHIANEKRIDFKDKLKTAKAVFKEESKEPTDDPDSWAAIARAVFKTKKST